MKLRHLIVKPDLPDELQPLRIIGMNMWFTWNPEASRLFQALDPDLWEICGHNPIMLLSRLSEFRIREILEDNILIDRIRELERQFDNYVSNIENYSFNLERPIDYRIAYFSMEYGISECLPIYSGGLGILAGDHLKSASNLCFPLIGLGLLYQKGYFRQYLNIDGWQQESYPDNDFYNMPISPVGDGSGGQLSFDLELDGVSVKILIWKVQVGRIPLYLLDSSHPSNPASKRLITAELYGGDLEMRIMQEIVLGVGGARALHLLGLWPFVYHLNEGHAAFAALERIRQTMITYKTSFEIAMEAVTASTVFTTHTPVPAGIDLFPQDLIYKYFRRYMESMGMTVKDLLDLGCANLNDKSSPFSMAVLALRLSRGVNAVSKIHHDVSKKMWGYLWPQVEQDDIPIGYVTNGVHIPSFHNERMSDLFDRYLGEGWIEEPDNTKIWSRVYNIPHDQIWTAHETRRERLVNFCRRRLMKQMSVSGGSTLDQKRVREYLNPEALTIGFARRFAPYKRADLVLSDPDRMLRLMSDKRRPIQFIFSGKAHPKDMAGKEIIKKVVHQSRSEGLHRNLVFIEDYDINVARYLLQGCDVWLNTPKRPKEACGTSGMKAAANGVLNLSILDGWWPEAFDGTNGWAIGSDEDSPDSEDHDRRDAEQIFDLLEYEIIPLFFNRGPDGLPHAWIEKMKNSMSKISGYFNSHRMIEQYMEEYYLQAGLAHQILGENKLVRSVELSEWKKKVRSLWKDVKVVDVSAPAGEKVSLGQTLEVTASIQLGQLRDEEVIVDLCHGTIGHDGNSERLVGRNVTPMVSEQRIADGVWRFKGLIHCEETGVYAYYLRVLPFHPYLFNPLSMNLVAWG
ncbi:MAG: alpha-glucan family phosphorylase [Deltaproteobacteria bacterium]|nr:alpha-glucan family phosphorylase [Deltaproteobacteria bacterium]